MSDERWRQVDRIFHDVLEQEVHDRGPFLDRACAEDLALRNEIEDLLRSYEEAGNFMESPASDSADGTLGLRGSSSFSGRTFGRYELRSLLGSGGMGDVYLARDSELKRDIAIKVLPDAFSRDAERVARFRREAEILASLNHSNIAAIYDFETLGEAHCLVLELVEGDTLADRLMLGPMQVDEALRLAEQIAEALEAAHEKGIIHRDLKPANIKITQDGTVKVLDFGLAKVREGEAAANGIRSSSPATMTTTPGMIMGTVAYMSPEQARGKGVDKRTDIWAFGCVLYEMLTGRALFGRDTATDTLAAILERDPAWSKLPVTTPSSIQRLLFRCLDKDLRSRLHDIADARIEIEDALKGALSPAEAGVVDRPQPPAGLRWSVVTAASLVALVAIGALTWRVLTTPQAEPARGEQHTTIATSGEAALRLANLRSLAIVPDGKGVLYIGGNTLWFRRLDRLEPTRLANGAAPLNFVFASADGLWAGLIEGTRLEKVPLGGGPAVTISLSNHRPFLGATWAPDQTIIFADNDRKTGLKRVSAEGGEEIVLTQPDSKVELDHIWPEMLPGGRGVLFTITALTGGLDAARVAVLDLGTLTYKPLVGGSHAHYVPSGHLVYTVGNSLQAIGFDPVRLEIFGTPVTVPRVPRVVTNRQGGGDFDVAANGTLVYVDAPATTEEARALSTKRTLVWVDRQGQEQALEMPPRPYLHPSLSPDEKQVAFVIGGPGAVDTSDIWTWDLSRGKFTQVTSTRGQAPIWLDGRHLAFFSPGSSPAPSLLRKSADDTGQAEGLYGGEGEAANGPPSGVTPDGKLLFMPGGADIMQLSINPREVQPLLHTTSIERNGVVSADGRWLAYESDTEGAGPFEIYVAPYPNVSARRNKISSDGGTRPLWASSKELLYVAPDGAIMAAGVDSGGMRSGDAKKIVEGGPYMNLGGGGAASPRQYDVARDGRLLLVKKNPGDHAAPPQIILVQNWLETLKRLAPAKP